MDDYRITIKSLAHSQKQDKSKYYLIDIKFIINDKRFEHVDYIDPFTNRIVRDEIPTTKVCEGNSRNKLLNEFLIRFGITHPECLQLLSKFIDKLNHVIEHNDTVRKSFPTILDLIIEAQEWRFDCRKIEPFFHFIKTEADGTEQHIHTTSIRVVVQEINNYRTIGATSEVYTFSDLQFDCRWIEDFYIQRNAFNNGWSIYYRGKKPHEPDSEMEPGRYKSRSVYTLRELSDAILDAKPYSPHI
ncbi:hypothetical protein [Methylomonas sp. MgM2]